MSSQTCFGPLLSTSAVSVWAKSNRETQDGSWNPLIAHMLDVAACAEAILELEPDSTRQLYAADFGFTGWEQARPWALALMGMHDLGKASPTFQNLWPDGLSRVESSGLSPFASWKRLPPNSSFKGGKYQGFKPIHHGFISQMALIALLQDSLWEKHLAELAADAVGAHHGWRATSGRLDFANSHVQDTGGDAWVALRRELYEAMLLTLGADPKQPPPAPDFRAGAYVRLAGLTSFTDWIASNIATFPFVAQLEEMRTLDGLRRYYAERLLHARKALRRLGWTQRQTLMAEKCRFEAIFGNSPRPLQAEVARYAETASSPVLLLVEAPMGEGKTEAAFFAHLLLQQRLGHRGMYVALPTQATGNAMFKRAMAFLESLGHSEEIDLQLAHGATLLNDEYQALRKAEIFEEDIEPDAKQAGIRAAEWFTNKKRALLSEYGVGTVDQALIGVLRVKHFFVRLWGLGNRTVVIDEVHAYDTYTSTLIDRLIKWLHALGASVIVMTATLPPSRRRQLLKAYGAENASIPEIPYPRAFRAMDGKIEGKHFAADPERRLELKIRALPAEVEAIAEQAIELVAAGGCLGCVMNTVQRAQELFSAIRARAPEMELYLFHARYPAIERQRIEDEVLQKFGAKGDRPRQAILVATQVIEQSLDLDFDVMISDLAPIDLLLQRAGRAHRHAKNKDARWGHEPVLYIAGLALEENQVPHWKEPLYWEILYDKDVLLYTQYFLQRYLQENIVINLPGDIDACICKVYDEPLELPDWLQVAVEKAEDKSLIARSMDRGTAKDAMIGAPDDGSWRNAFSNEKHDPDDNPDVYQGFWARTRLGNEALTLIPLVQNERGFIHARSGETLFVPSSEPSESLAKELYLQHVKLSKKELVTFFREGCKSTEQAALVAQLRENWSKNPLLRNCYPMLLNKDCVQIGNLTVKWDKTLGIVYEKDQKATGGRLG